MQCLTTTLILTFSLLCSGMIAQGQTDPQVGTETSARQTVRGTVIDGTTGSPLPFATVTVEGTEPRLGASADKNGEFKIENVPVGRYDIQATYPGYESAIVKDVVVGTGKEVVLTLTLRESLEPTEEVTIKPRTSKERALNRTATASARMFSVEEAQRYAGGFDDPARLASSFAGVGSNVGNNGVVIRGNAPKALSWRMEGVEIPNPNHFADLAAFGGGGLTALSSQMLDNSDFFTGAFPAEYGNALSGVFDLHLRNGNSRTFEHALQIGLTGIDISSEGPFIGKEGSSYLFNYRYSTLSLLEPLLPEDAGGTGYQDFSFKLNSPVGASGVLSLWGIGALDVSGQSAETDSTKWEYDDDKKEQQVNQSMGALGLGYRQLLGSSAYLHAGLTATGNGLDLRTDKLNDSFTLVPNEKIETGTWNYIFSTFVKSKISTRHSNKTGVEITALNYNLLLQSETENDRGIETIVNEKGTSYLIAPYSSSNVRLSDRFSMTFGLYSHYFTLSKKLSVEPRAGIEWQLTPEQTLGIAYGLHSRLERLNYYFVRPATSGSDDELPNSSLDFTKASHIVLSYDWGISTNLHLKVEPYYQWLFNVPVRENSSFSFINLENDWFLNDRFVNAGTGRNVGIDITFEHFLTDGYYFLTTASLFDSKYRGGDNIWRNTRFNRNYLLNVLGGKEWNVGKMKQNVLGVNVRLTLQGGDPQTPVDEESSLATGEVTYDESRAFELRDDPSLVLHFGASFRINGSGHASIIALNVINGTGRKEFEGYRYNLQEHRIDRREEAIIIPNISYKLEF